MFQFDSLYAFWVMEGHGLYVWSAYLVSLAIMVWLVAGPVVRRRQLLRSIRRRQQVERYQSTLEQ